MFVSAPPSIATIVNSFAGSIKLTTPEPEILLLAEKALRRLCDKETSCRGTLPCNEEFFTQARTLVKEAVDQITGFLLAARARSDELAITPGDGSPGESERMLLIEVVKQTLRLICAEGLPGLESQLVARDTAESVKQYVIIEAQRAEAVAEASAKAAAAEARAGTDPSAEGSELEIPTNAQPLQEALQKGMEEFHEAAFVQSVALYYYHVRSYATLLVVHEERPTPEGSVYPLYQVATIRNQLNSVIEALKYDTLTNESHIGAIMQFEAGIASAAERPQEFPQRLARVSATIVENLRVVAGYSAGKVPDAFANITLAIPKPWPETPAAARMNPALWCGLYLGRVGQDPELSGLWNYVKATRDKDLFNAATPDEKIKLLAIVSEAVANANAIESLIGAVMTGSEYDRATLATELLSYLKNESQTPPPQGPISELFGQYKSVISGMAGTGFPVDGHTGLPFGLLTFPQGQGLQSDLPVYISFNGPGMHVLLMDDTLTAILEPGLPLSSPGTDCWNAQIQAQELARLLQGLSAYTKTGWYSGINQLLVPGGQNPNAWNPLTKGERDGIAFPFPASWYTLGFKKDGTPFTAKPVDTDCPASTLYDTFEGFFLTMYQGMNVGNLPEIQERARAAVASSTPPVPPCISPSDISIDRRFAVAAEREPGFKVGRTQVAAEREPGFEVKDAWRIASVSHAAWVFWTREKGDDKKRELLDRWVDAWKQKRNTIVQKASAPAPTQGAPALTSSPTLPHDDADTTVNAGAPAQGTPPPH